MENDRREINLSELDISPLTSVRGAFSAETEDGFGHLVRWFRTAAITAQREKKSKTYVARIDGETIGFLTVSSLLVNINPTGKENTTNFDPQLVLLGKLYVGQNYRSAGIGTRLLDFVVDVANNMDMLLGCQGIMVDANPDPRTVDFYKRYGFEEIGTADGDVRMFFKLP